MGFYPELDNLNLAQLIERFAGPPLDGPEYGTAFYQEVASLIRQHDPAGLDFLLRELPKRGEDTERLRGILLGLRFPPSESLDQRALLRPYLRDERPLVVADAVDGLAQAGVAEAVEEVLPLREHPSPYVRASVLRAVGQLPLQRAWPVLREALHDSDSLVRETALDELATAVLGAVEGHKAQTAIIEEATEAIKAMLEDEDPGVRDVAQDATWVMTA